MSRNRVYVRKFDWEEARRRFAAGESQHSIARSFGVSDAAVYRVVSPGAMSRMREAGRYRQQQGTCRDCGSKCSWNSSKGKADEQRCIPCAAIAAGTSAREGELLCFTCQEWLPDSSFPNDRAKKFARRGKHPKCRDCNTKARRAFREKHKVPCANGCGSLVLAPNEQQSSARSHGSVASGMCPPCEKATRKTRARAA